MATSSNIHVINATNHKTSTNRKCYLQLSSMTIVIFITIMRAYPISTILVLIKYKYFFIDFLLPHGNLGCIQEIY